MQGATAEQLRHDIDTGRCGDKVCWPDPAAAPLGTDEEAAGMPTTPEQLAEARAHHSFVTRKHARPNAGWVLVGAAMGIGVSVIWAGLWM